MDGSAEGGWLSDKQLVDSVLRDLTEAADRWEALVTEAEATTYSVEMPDVFATANSSGKLISLALHPDVTTDYTHGELTERLNVVFAALRAEVADDYHSWYGGELE